MTEYTPTTEEVQADYLNMQAFLADDNDTEANHRAVMQWERWLAKRDRQVREELWDEIVPQHAHDWYWHDGGREQNPYRKEATGD